MSNNALFQCFGQCDNESRQEQPQGGGRTVPLAEKAFESLSPEEKESVARDLYGIEEPIEESPEFVRSKLADLDNELNSLSEDNRKHYNLALHIEAQQHQHSHAANGSSSINSRSINMNITGPKFRMMFLRADRFNTHKAARRMTRYFTEKIELFGAEKLARRICIDDLDGLDDKKALISGGISFTGATDWAGRSIVLIRREQCFRENLISLRRVAFLTFQNALLDDNKGELAQKKRNYFSGIQHWCYTLSTTIGYKSHLSY